MATTPSKNQAYFAALGNNTGYVTGLTASGHYQTHETLFGGYAGYAPKYKQKDETMKQEMQAAIAKMLHQLEVDNTFVNKSGGTTKVNKKTVRVITEHAVSDFEGDDAMTAAMNYADEAAHKTNANVYVMRVARVVKPKRETVTEIVTHEDAEPAHA